MRKRKLISYSLAIVLFYCACSKHDNPTDTPIAPPVDTSHSTSLIVTDSLSAGWQLITIDTLRHFSDIFFLNEQIGFVCGQNYIGKSTDGGLTWKNTLPASIGGDCVNLFFTDVNNGWAFGSKFLRTTDGGSTWMDLKVTATFDGQFFDANNGYVTSPTGTLFKTTDGGVTLQQVPSGNLLRVLYFSDNKHGWLSATSLFKTNDGGTSFQQLASVNLNQAYVAQFTDSLHGWIGGGIIYRTVDGGATFQSVIAGPGGGDFHFFDNNNGFIMCGNRIYATTNGGQSLNILCRFKTANLWEIHFTDPRHGWIVADGGFIYRYVKP